ncbi:uncharacterized protein PHACADRAFT_252732 [Phanerochaete carnosa HHB-10118-sp]|uniref:AAA+ ATPase domain-containing protein n=1 Tax=Phanerochaete carnosa (strain HHB-10118-sp) TaxID=650164 RepID=K5X6E5_PHACS|nr:uncharacterized protein PHACADRAFT_252732 [Phanerochaete carnosa HHB-10118-sp]EKM58422.1 hypothetical protein PHACADRAFT_252732 [Phanerochaete carnosa HHB-10118-sp]
MGKHIGRLIALTASEESSLALLSSLPFTSSLPANPATMNTPPPLSADARPTENGQAAPARQGDPERRTQIARYDMLRTSRYELRKTHRPVIAEKLKKKKPIILVKRHIDSRGQLEGTQLDIYHEGLRTVLLEINRNVRGLELTARTPTIDTNVLFHSHTQLEDKLRELEEAEDPQDQDLVEGIQAALRFVREDLTGTIQDYNALISQQQITFEYLWALFRPNVYVYAYHDATDQHFVAHARKLTYGRTQTGTYAKVECDIIARDYVDFGLASYDFEIQQFAGARSIHELPVYPLEYYPGHEALYRDAVSRGQRYADLRLHCYQHHGIATVHVDSETNLKLTINERIMIDVESFFEFGHQRRFAPEVYRELDPEQLSEEELLICTPVVLGFCFTTKLWGAFAIDRIAEVDWSEEPFERLVMGKQKKHLIRSLVTQHTSQQNFDDVVAGKGRGLVGLLCGPPGCGKTLTAEAVAEIAKKPLYAVSAGELGTSPLSADSSLRRVLQLGERWDAVVLLDEADVFLQERDKTDVSRNALVSIFLRRVEYYPGILIFTTNLIKQIDPAFESRIHFCMMYSELDFASRKQVWRTFLAKAGIADAEIGEHNLVRLSQKQLNGRQIKNAVGTAKSIASAESSRLELKHVLTVLDVMQDWRIAKSERTLNLYPIALGIAGIVCSLVYLRRLGASLPSLS